MVAVEDMERFNPWWKTGEVRAEWTKDYKRKVYYEAERYMEKRQIILLWGLRRLGKTTIMFQLIRKLLADMSPKNVLYFSFDEAAFDLKDVLESYQKLIINKPFSEAAGRIYVFLDEAHKVSDWESKIKVYYDLYPNIKFFVSGSASVRLRRKSKESLAGRVFDFALSPLDFEEYLEIRGMDLKKIKENPDLWKSELLPAFYHYIKFGMLPELVSEENEEFARKYIINNLTERIIYKDIPEEFAIKDLELLKALFYMVAKKPGMIVNYRALSKSMGKDQRTIANYFEYLDYSLLIKLVINYRGSPVASMRKMKKAYLATPNIAAAFSENLEAVLPQMLENLVLCITNARFFYRNSFEVDFVLEEDGKLTAIEVKKEGAETKQLKKFAEKFGKKLRKALIVDMEDEGEKDGIIIMPAWKLMLLFQRN